MKNILLHAAAYFSIFAYFALFLCGLAAVWLAVSGFVILKTIFSAILIALFLAVPIVIMRDIKA